MSQLDAAERERRRRSFPHPRPTPYHLMLRTWDYAWWRPVVGVLVALRGVRETPTSAGGLDWRRHLELCLAGLRP